MKQSRSDTLWRVLAWIIRILLIGCTGYLIFSIFRLQMLPVRYFLILSALLALLVLGICLLLRRPKPGKWERPAGRGRQILGAVLALALIAGSAVGAYVVSTLNNTISSITSIQTVHVLLEVYVLADDPAAYVQDTAEYVFAVSDSVEESDTQAALADLTAVLGREPAVRHYTSAFETIDALYAGEVGAVILDSSYLSILDSLEGYGDFPDRARVLHEYVIEKERPQQAPSGSGILLTPTLEDISETPFLLYISGNDARRELLADGGSDVNILVAVNPVDKQILMINTPRDYYVVNPASGDGSRDKLSHCGLKGIDNCISAITGLYNQPIHYYARINFSGFRTLIDAIGGVTVQVEVPFNASSYYFHKGENHLNGKQALAFARERKNLAGGDNDRGKNQMRLIEGMIRKLASPALLKNYGEIMASLEGMFSTSMSPADIARLVQLQLSQMPQWEIYSFAVTGDGGSDFCWAAGGSGYVMYPHENMVAHASALIEKVLNGEVLTQEDMIVE